MIDKISDWAFKSVFYVFRYLKHRPDLHVSFEYTSSGSSGGPQARTLEFFWGNNLVLHNDSPHLARGIKVCTPFPTGWTLNADFPTRLDPDQRLKLPIRTVYTEDQQHLTSQFGTSTTETLKALIQPEVMKRFTITIAFENEYGRHFFQTFRWVNGSIQSEFVKKPS